MMIFPRKTLLSDAAVDEVLSLCRQGSLGRYDPGDRPVLVSGMILSPWITAPRECKLGLSASVESRVRLLFSPGGSPAFGRLADDVIADRFGRSFGSLFFEPEPCAVVVASVDRLFVADSYLFRYRAFSTGGKHRASRMGVRANLVEALVAADDWLLVALCGDLRWALVDADSAPSLGVDWLGAVEHAPDSRLEILTRGSSGLIDTALTRWVSWPNRTDRSETSTSTSLCSHIKRFGIRIISRSAPTTDGLSGLGDWPIAHKLDWSIGIVKSPGGWKGEVTRQDGRPAMFGNSGIGSVNVVGDDRKDILDICGRIDGLALALTTVEP